MRLLLFLLFFSSIAFAQSTEDIDHSLVAFDLKFPVDSASTEIIDWERENLSSTIKLQGPVPLTYTIAVPNDITALLYKHEGEQKVYQEKLQITGWILRHVQEDYVVSEFKITDFDEDGDEDLLCWVNTNANGNVWTIILLNDNKNQKLVKLWDIAEDTDIWDAPEYDADNHTINTYLFSSAYGISNECVYLLEGTEVTPVSKSEGNSTNSKYIIASEYIGKNGKWKLVKRKKIR